MGVSVTLLTQGHLYLTLIRPTTSTIPHIDIAKIIDYIHETKPDAHVVVRHTNISEVVSFIQCDAHRSG